MFCRPEAFDAVVNLFTSFGYFEDQAQDRKVVENVFRSLAPGGRLIMDMIGKEVLARVFRERDWYRVGDVIVLEERRLAADWSWIDTRWIMIRGDSLTELSVSHRLYSAAELEGLLTQCGFERVRAHGDLAGRPYDHGAQRLVMVAERPCRAEAQMGR